MIAFMLRRRWFMHDQIRAMAQPRKVQPKIRFVRKTAPQCL